MRTCMKCGQHWDDNIKFCPNCGFNFTLPQQQSPPQSSSFSLKRILIIIIIIGVLVGVGILAYYNLSSVQVKYNSVWGNPVKFVIDGQDRGEYSSDAYHTFSVSPGVHQIEIFDIGTGLRLSEESVNVPPFTSVQVEMSWGSY